MSVKTSDEKIAQIKVLRLKGYSQAFICNAVEVSIFVVQQACKDIKMDLRFKTSKLDKCKNAFPCITYPFSELSEEDQKKYNMWFEMGLGRSLESVEKAFV